MYILIVFNNIFDPFEGRVQIAQINITKNKFKTN